MNLVFVYGTLRQGGVREMPRLFPQTEFIGFGTAKGRLYDFGAYPGFMPNADAGDVIGEVYAVPAIVLQNQDIRAVVRVRPDIANRRLTVALDAGEFYSSTERNLDGDRAARTYEFYFRKLPAGEYRLNVQVADAAGRIRMAERHITVLGEGEVVDLSRRR